MDSTMQTELSNPALLDPAVLHMDAARSEGPRPIVTLVAGLAAEEVDRRLREAARWADVGNRALAFYLADMKLRGLYQVLGQPTIVSYAVRGLGMSRRRVRDLLLVGERLPELRSIDRSFAAGWLPWSKVRLLCRVATPETESAWLRCAERCTQDELAHQVRGKRPGDLPQAGEGLPGPKFRIVADLDAVQQMVWENAREKLRAESGYDTDVTDTDILMEMARLLLASDADGSVPGRRPVDGSIYKVVIRSEDTGARLVTEDGEVALPPEIGEMIAADGVVPPRLRRRVLARDGHRCRHCGCRRSLHVHHVQWRSKGGATESSNLVTMCAKCHGLVHAGLLDVEPVDVGSVGSGSEVAPCATPAAVGERTFRFLDKDGRPLGGTWREGPQVRTAGLAVSTVAPVAPVAPASAGSAARPASTPTPAPPIRAASPALSGRAAVTELDPVWFRAHLDWFEDAPGGLRVKRRHREEFERLFAR